MSEHKIANYTTTVPADRSIQAITQMLVRAGARQMLSEFDDQGTAAGLSFALATPQGMRTYRLPARHHSVLAVLQRQRVERRYQTPEHATRVAWRILHDWVRAQLAIIETGMVTTDEVFLPYLMVDAQRTAYELFVERNLAIGSGA